MFFSCCKIIRESVAKRKKNGNSRRQLENYNISAHIETWHQARLWLVNVKDDF